MVGSSTFSLLAVVALVGIAHGAVETKLKSAGGSPFEHFVTDSALQAPEESSSDRDSPVGVADANFFVNTDQTLVLRVDGPSGFRSQLKQLDDKSWLSTSEFGERRSVSGDILLLPENGVNEVTFASVRTAVTSLLRAGPRENLTPSLALTMSDHRFLYGSRLHRLEAT